MAMAAVALWLITLALPAEVRMCEDVDAGAVPGLEMLLLGWLGPLALDAPIWASGIELILESLHHLAWFANPIWLHGIVRMWRGTLTCAPGM